MTSKILCRCCLVRPPDKDLKTHYKCGDKKEIYGDMLKECFEIYLPIEQHENLNGICEVCITRLKDACDFKDQVLRCQKDFQTIVVKVEETPKIKEECMDTDDDGICLAVLKTEMSDDDDTLAVRKLKVVRKKRVAATKKKNAKLKDNQIAIKVVRKLSPSIQFMTEFQKHKQNIENIIKYSNCTPFSNKTLSGIICSYCKKTYKNTEELQIHKKEIHKKDELQYNNNQRIDKVCLKIDITNLKCNLCDENIDVISNLKKHLIAEHCVKFFPDVADNIMEFKLTEEDIHSCALCHSKFETFKMLIQHMHGHYRNFICDVCDAGFINKERCANHKRSHEIGSFKCGFCDDIFDTRARKLCHEKKLHKTKSPLNCPYCDQTFASYYQRNRHMFSEHNVTTLTYKCNICDKSFILKSILTSHIKRVHLMERNHVCTECGQSFFGSQVLKEHMVRHSGERMFKCTVCHKAYARKKTLIEHMKIHNNDRRFKCDVCGLAFVQKCSLKSHLLSNHGLSITEYENSRSELSSP